MVRARNTAEFTVREAVEHDNDGRAGFDDTDNRLLNFKHSDDSATQEKTNFLNDAGCPDRLEMAGLSEREREAVFDRVSDRINEWTARNDVEARLGFAQAAVERLTHEDADPNWTEAIRYGLHHGEDPKILNFYYQSAHKEAHETLDWNRLRELHFSDEAGQATFVDSFVNSWAAEMNDYARGNLAATAEAHQATEFFKERFNNEGIPDYDSPEWEQVTRMQDYFLELGHGVEFHHGHLEDYHPPDIPPDITPENVNRYVEQVTQSLGDHWNRDRNQTPYTRQLEQTHREAVIAGLVTELQRSNAEFEAISHDPVLYSPAQQSEARRDTTLALNAVAHAIRPA